MTSLTTIRRASGIALLIGWIATLAIGIGALRADTGRAADKGIALEIPIAGLSLAATVVYAVSRLGRAHMDDIKWALGADRKTPSRRRPEEAQDAGSPENDLRNVHPIRADVNLKMEPDGSRSTSTG